MRPAPYLPRVDAWAEPQRNPQPSPWWMTLWSAFVFAIVAGAFCYMGLQAFVKISNFISRYL